jgi:tight adherence protein C
VRTGLEDRPPALLEMIARLGGFLPAREGRDALRTGLIRAGFRQRDAVTVFLGTKVVLAVALPILWIAYTYMSGRPLGNALLGFGILAALGFYAPTIYMSWRQNERRHEIQSSLPDALDLLVVCVEAGLGIAAALHRVAGELRVACRPLSDELTVVHQEMLAGVSRTDALRNLAVRTDIDDLFSLTAMLIQTDKLGTSVADALRAHAESMRTRRRQRAEQMARKAAVKLVVPLVFLILPALLVVILGPAAIVLVRALVQNNG